MTEPPAWTPQAFALIDQFNQNGLRITALRLTDEQKNDLRNYTMQDTTLFGYPVKGGGAHDHRE